MGRWRRSVFTVLRTVFYGGNFTVTMRGEGLVTSLLVGGRRRALRRLRCSKNVPQRLKPGFEVGSKAWASAQAYLRSKSENNGKAGTTAEARVRATATANTGVSPLRCAPVEMTRVGGGVFQNKQQQRHIPCGNDKPNGKRIFPAGMTSKQQT